ncbi:lasso peptide isopeptide bond-forming cyclase [Acinetobacter gyllenbergii]|uniref:lasso peptide isopeptide bond-forming cyclase n=1 Tax=Acinetobacter gyllenbergii TaxID=134534 RepID=UPI0024203125|nr:lasso peptide isopeptide bond-forming cyclase [Acinetobacter gyllenbergii]
MIFLRRLVEKDELSLNKNNPYKSKVFDNFYFEHDTSFDVCEHDNFCVIFNGEAFSYTSAKSLKSILFEVGSVELLLKEISDLVGKYTILIIYKNTLNVIQSLYKNIDIYYMVENDEFYVTSNLSALLSTGNFEIDTSYAYSFILNKRNFGLETPFKNVKIVPQGESCLFKSSNNISRSLVSFREISKVNYIEEISKNINLFNLDKDSPLYVSFSGGLDSSVVLYSALMANFRPKAIHLLPPEEHSSELEIAQSVAKEFDVELLVFKHPYFLSGRETFQPSTLTYNISDIHILSSGLCETSEIYNDLMKSEALPLGLTLTGQGGDFIFMQNPPENIGFDALKEKGLRSFLNKTKQYSLLKKARYFNILHKNIKNFIGNLFSDTSVYNNFFDNNVTLSESKHLLLDSVSNKSAKYDYIHGVLTGLYSVKPTRNDGYKILHPLYLQNIVFNIINNSVCDMFNEDHDRLIIREQFYRKSQSEVAWRKTKRSSSGALFMFLNNNRELIYDYLLNGYVVDTLKINKKWLDEEISQNTMVGITNNCGIVMNILQLEIYYRQFVWRVK